MLSKQQFLDRIKKFSILLKRMFFFNSYKKLPATEGNTQGNKSMGKQREKTTKAGKTARKNKCDYTGENR